MESLLRLLGLEDLQPVLQSVLHHTVGASRSTRTPLITFINSNKKSYIHEELEGCTHFAQQPLRNTITGQNCSQYRDEAQTHPPSLAQTWMEEHKLTLNVALFLVFCARSQQSAESAQLPGTPAWLTASNRTLSGWRSCQYSHRKRGMASLYATEYLAHGYAG